MSELIPKSFRTTVTDRFVSAFFSPKSDIMLQFEMQFDHHLVADIVGKSLQLALDAEPILGCRFSIENGKVVWQRLEDRQRDKFYVFTDEKEYMEYRNQSLDATTGPALQGGLLQNASGDRLLLKIAHEVSDAAGAKDIGYLVASLYQQLAVSPHFHPAPNIKGYRSARQIFKHVPRRALPGIWFNALKEMLPLILQRTTCNPFATPCNTTRRDYEVRTIPPERVATINTFCRNNTVTINDVFLAVFLCAVHQNSCVSNAALRCGMTVDLRQWYLPGGHAETIANLSGFEFVHLGKVSAASFQSVIKKVVRFTKRRKKQWIGLSSHAGILNFFRPWPYEKMCSLFTKQQQKDIRDMAVIPMFTNLGPIDRELLKFDTPPISAHLIAPAGLPPYFGMGLSGYGDTLTLSTVSYPETSDKIKQIFDDMLEELPE